MPDAAGILLRVRKNSPASRLASAIPIGRQRFSAAGDSDFSIELSGEVYLSNVLFAGWNHILLSLLWENESENVFRGRVSSSSEFAIFWFVACEWDG